MSAATAIFTKSSWAFWSLQKTIQRILVMRQNPARTCEVKIGFDYFGSCDVFIPKSLEVYGKFIPSNIENSNKLSNIIKNHADESIPKS